MNLKNSRDSARIPAFIYTSRLSSEKWVDRIIAFARILLESEVCIGTLAIYNGGEGEKSFVSELSGYVWFLDARGGERKLQWGERVVFYGFQSQETLKEALKRSHYLLMPSRFLETFGLSALEAISFGTVVVGYKKGWIAPFLLSEIAIPDAYNDAKDSSNFLITSLRLAEEFDLVNWKKQSEGSREIAENFSSQVWTDRAKKFLTLKKSEKILLVTDYSAKIGGIETHLDTITSFLESLGHTVEVWAPMVGRSRFLRLVALAFSNWNPIFSLRLRKKIQTFKPSIVWAHSITRALWPLSLEEINETTAKKVITYHDLGFFGAYATKFEHEYDLIGELRFATFYREAPLLDKCLPIYLFWKYLRLKAIQKELQKFDIHFVPSKFMIEPLRAYLLDEWADVHVFPHASIFL